MLIDAARGELCSAQSAEATTRARGQPWDAACGAHRQRRGWSRWAAGFGRCVRRSSERRPLPTSEKPPGYTRQTRDARGRRAHAVERPARPIRHAGTKMQRVVLALALTGASAFVAPVPKAVQQVRMSDDAEAEAPEVEAAPAPAPPKPAAAAPTGAFSRQDLYDYAASMPGFGTGPWDPLGLADQSWAFGERTPFSNEATIGFLRHAEIKHGRVAMAAFLGFIAQSTALVSGEHTFAPYRGYVAGCTPQEQWDNIPVVGKLQILIAIGMLESYGEGAAAGPEYTHYMRGGQPGFYPDIKGKCNGQIGINLYDPFGFGFRDKPADKRARGLKSEILNGRAAMFGIMGFLAESKVPGSVPILSKISGFPHYDGDVMAPFAPEIHLNF